MRRILKVENEHNDYIIGDDKGTSILEWPNPENPDKPRLYLISSAFAEIADEIVAYRKKHPNSKVLDIDELPETKPLEKKQSISDKLWDVCLGL